MVVPFRADLNSSVILCSCLLCITYLIQKVFENLCMHFNSIHSLKSHLVPSFIQIMGPYCKCISYFVGRPCFVNCANGRHITAYCSRMRQFSHAHTLQGVIQSVLLLLRKTFPPYSVYGRCFHSGTGRYHYRSIKINED